MSSEETKEPSWYRVPLTPQVHRDVHKLSDVEALKQVGGWLALLFSCGAASVYFVAAEGNDIIIIHNNMMMMLLSVIFALLYGTIANFSINGMHELGHGSVFKTQVLNRIFLRIFSLIGWLHPDMFFESHLRHHRYTLFYPTLDRENEMPVKLSMRQFLEFGFVNVKGCIDTLRYTVRCALGQFPTGHLGWNPEWEKKLYGDDESCSDFSAAVKEKRMLATRWARMLLSVHLVAWAVAAALVFLGRQPFSVFVAPFLFSFGPFISGWLFFVCNSTQHVGLRTNVADFRLNSRTIQLPWAIGFLYFHMNFHVEHHMYAAVPCYRLSTLHEAIRHKLPPTKGLVEAWREIAECVAKQKQDPTWQLVKEV